MEGPASVLESLYEEFERQVRDWTSGAICKAGCADCCSQSSVVEMTTLEGWRIREHLRTLPGGLAGRLYSQLAKDRKNRERGRKSRCPFLSSMRRCHVYPVRPFVCRRLYSTADCTLAGPVLHKDVIAIGKAMRMRLQCLDPVGYSGHLSFVMGLLEEPVFRENWTAGKGSMRELSGIIRKHHLVIHQSLPHLKEKRKRTGHRVPHA